MLLTSCDGFFTEKEVYGAYSPVDYKNNFDTIQLMPHNIYRRKVYDKNKKLLLDMKGKWELENNINVHFEPFYLNLDDDLVEFPNKVSDTTGGWGGRLEIHKRIVHFCVGYDVSSNCYRKIK